MSNEQSIRDELIGLRLASYSKIMSDGYPSGIIRGNEEAADILLASPVIRRIQAEAIREASDEVYDLYFGDGATGSANRWGAKQAAERLRQRADLIENGEV